MNIRLVLLVAINFIGLSACTTAYQNQNSCDHFDQVITANLRDAPNAKSRDAKLSCDVAKALAKSNQPIQVIPNGTPPDPRFFVNDKGGCLPGVSENCPYALEAGHLNHDWPPMLGLSLSGGGTRRPLSVLA